MINSVWLSSFCHQCISFRQSLPPKYWLDNMRIGANSLIIQLTLYVLIYEENQGSNPHSPNYWIINKRKIKNVTSWKSSYFFWNKVGSLELITNILMFNVLCMMKLLGHYMWKLLSLSLSRHKQDIICIRYLHLPSLL